MKESKLPFWRQLASLSIHSTIRKIGLLMLFVLLSASLSATHYRYGTISWKRIPGAAPGTCDIEVTVKQAWRTSYPWGGAPVVGSTITTGTLFSTPMFGAPGGPSAAIGLTVTSVNPVDDWFFGEWKDTISLPSDTGHYMLSYSGCCRISSLINNADEGFRSESVVTPCSIGNESPVSTQVPIVKLPKGVAVNSFMVAATDPDSDPLSYRLATAFESGDVANTNPVGFSISPGGMASFSTIGKSTGDLFNAFVYIEDTAGASTMADFIIEVVDSSTPPEFDFAVTPGPAPCFEVEPGDTVKFTVKASDPDPGDSVFISAVGVPIGASFTPALPTSGGNPDSTVFMWVPDTSDIGTTIISFTAEDTSGVSTSTSICIVVSLKPIFSVPPTPPEGVHLFYECGDTITFPVDAYDPDPADSVQIFKVEGKSMGGAKIPLYPGATFMPFPTPWANPTGGLFYWETDSTTWGHRHVYFTAKDGFGETTEHEVSILVNAPPKFLSTPDTCVYVDSMYCYSIEVMDKDTANGDSIDLFGFALPSWLTFVDSGNGRGSLCGTPTLADLGTYAILLEAHDVHHHETGIVPQIFDILVKSDSAVECVIADSSTFITDTSWRMSTVVTPANLSGTWSGVGGVLPGDGTFTMPAVIGQPYAFPSIDSVNGAHVIKTGSNVTYFQKKFMLSGNEDVSMRLRLNVDDHIEIYVNGHLLAAQYSGRKLNFKNPEFDVLLTPTSIDNPNASGQMIDFLNPAELDTVFEEGLNNMVVALRNYGKSSDAGGFSMRMDLDYSYTTEACDVLDSCVSDSSWSLSTVTTVATSNLYPWPGVGSYPPEATFTLPVVVGQPYPWPHLWLVPGSEPISSLSGVTYYMKKFDLTDHMGVNTRIRMFMDDNVEIFINGHSIATETSTGKKNWRTANHDILYKEDGTVDNGHMGGDMFDIAPATIDMDTVLAASNTLVLAIRNRTSKPDLGGFSFRMDIDKAGSSVLKKSAGTSAPASEITFNSMVQLYPNPAQSWVNVVLDEGLAKTGGTLHISDISGQMINEVVIEGVETPINIENLTPGVYLIQVQAGDRVMTTKLIKQ